MTGTFEFTVKNDLKDLVHLTREINRVLDASGVAYRLSYAANLALEEVVTNIIKYGYLDEREHEIKVTLKIGENAVRLVFKDDGRRFNPLTAPPVDVNCPLWERGVGGVGIHLLKNMMDSMEYSHSRGWNILKVCIEGPTGNHNCQSGPPLE